MNDLTAQLSKHMNNEGQTRKSEVKPKFENIMEHTLKSYLLQVLGPVSKHDCFTGSFKS